MARKARYDTAGIIASLNHSCPLCHGTITPDILLRINGTECRCRHCGGIYTPPSKGEPQQLHHSPARG